MTVWRFKAFLSSNVDEITNWTSGMRKRNTHGESGNREKKNASNSNSVNSESNDVGSDSEDASGKRKSEFSERESAKESASDEEHTRGDPNHVILTQTYDMKLPQPMMALE